MNLTTDFGQIEAVIQQKIDQNRGKVRVAADLSREGHRRDRGRRADAERSWPSRRSPNFEVELGLKSPETTPVAQAAKDLGPGDRENAPHRSRPTDATT